MKVVSSECIILKHQDFKERDRLVTFLARDKGRMAGIARGARKLTARGVGTFEPFSRGTIFYVEKPGAELVQIRKCDPVPPHLFLQADYDKILYAGYMAELVSLCRISQAEAEQFFLLLAGGLERLYEEKSPPALSLLRLEFELEFLACLGVQPNWSRCGVCERPLFDGGKGRAIGPRPLLSGVHQFDVSLGGMRCPDCRTGGWGMEDIAAGSLAFLAAWRHGGTAGAAGTAGIVKPTRAALVELERAVTRHLVYQLEREPRSLALLPTVDTLSRRPPSGRSKGA